MILNISNHYVNANQNHETTSHIVVVGCLLSKKTVGKDVEKLEAWQTVSGNVIKWCSCYRRHYGGSSKN